MTDQSSFDPELLDRYLAGELSVAERVRVEHWLATRPVTAQMVKELPGVVLGEAQVTTEASWQSLAARIRASDATNDLAVRRERNAADVPARRIAPWLRRASEAAALLLVAGGAVIWSASHRGGRIEAPLGRDVTALLPDGTRLTLAAGSHVTWNASYTRDVALEGQAYFDVVHDASRPFRVHTRDAVAEDIGTRFVVRAWPELTAVEVAVEEGSVALADSARARTGRGAILRAGQLGRLARDGRVVVTTDADAAVAWTRGELVFDNSPLTEVLPAISRQFDVDLSADPALAGRRLTARFTAQPLTELLNALAVSLDVRVESHGRSISLLPTIR